ncbi:MAG: UDP-N-acetylmuramoyl-tripeptide--D-alanyl-D-alanine ligase [Flavobacteriaceae bacterium]|nr:UDP-N-acetylmuramoyl-tripeptide--D-alanyl-D-alanine ligase [Bacteroidia bacterium]NNL61507.1 UDP-N-acetylmuramoyl-tripeptide--D-alanyl-D-alanine ligase [Flavobacteriaceae bacterium]
MRIKELHQLFLNSSGVSTDTRKVTENTLFFALKGDNFNGNEYADEALKKGASFAIVDEKEHTRSNKALLVEDVLTSLQELATFHRNFLKLPIIALTGSNGKTTTKELINAVLSKKYTTVATKGNFNNHIGVPLTLLSMNEHTEIGIVEMGANHQKEIMALCQIAQPDYGYITNFGKAHLEGFGGIEGVIKGKSELYEYLMDENKNIFLNADDGIQKEKLSGYIKKFGFSQKDADYYPIEFLEANPFVKLTFEGVSVSSNLIGTYNFANIAAAVMIGKYFNVDINDIKGAIEDYVPSNNRSQIIEKDNYRIILDAYNANPTSMKAALINLTNLSDIKKIAVLGDMFELGDDSAQEHQDMVSVLEGLMLDKIYLVGEHFFNTKTTSSNIERFKTFEDFKENFDTTEIDDSSVLIKGSRGMALERTLELL